MPSIDGKVRAGHEAAGVAHEEQRRSLELGRRRQPAQHVLAAPEILEPRVVPEVALDHRREDVAGTEAVDADAACAVGTQGTPFHGEVARELDDGGLGRVVDRAEQALVGDGAGHAGDEADAAVAAVAEHVAGCRSSCHEDGRVVDVHHTPRVLGRVLEGGRDLLDGCGRDGSMETLVLAGDLVDHSVEALSVGHIDLAVGQRAAPCWNYAAAGFVPVLTWSGCPVKTVHL